jgi:hypothetical protein
MTASASSVSASSVWQRLNDFVLGVTDVLQSMQQEVVHRLDVFAEEAHDRPFLGR